MGAFYWVGTAVAVLGVAEHLFPSLTRAIPGFSGNPETIVTDDGFNRARFSFYGGPIAAFVCVLTLPFSIALWKWRPSLSSRSAIALGGVAQLMAVYIAGWRSMWLLVAIQLVVFILMRKKYALGMAIVLLGSIGASMVADLPRARIESLIRVLEGKPLEADTSGQKRWTRVNDAFQAVADEPLGSGWAYAGWVHSDFLQIAANQGLAAGILFLALYVATLIKLYRLARNDAANRELPQLALSLLLAFLAVGGMHLFEGVEVTPQTVLPVWFIWALVVLRLQERVPSVTAVRSSAVRSRAARSRAWKWKPIALPN